MHSKEPERVEACLERATIGPAEIGPVDSTRERRQLSAIRSPALTGTASVLAVVASGQT